MKIKIKKILDDKTIDSILKSEEEINAMIEQEMKSNEVPYSKDIPINSFSDDPIEQKRAEIYRSYHPIVAGFGKMILENIKESHPEYHDKFYNELERKKGNAKLDLGKIGIKFNRGFINTSASLIKGFIYENNGLLKTNGK